MFRGEWLTYCHDFFRRQIQAKEPFSSLFKDFLLFLWKILFTVLIILLFYYFLYFIIFYILLFFILVRVYYYS